MKKKLICSTLSAELIAGLDNVEMSTRKRKPTKKIEEVPKSKVDSEIIELDLSQDPECTHLWNSVCKAIEISI